MADNMDNNSNNNERHEMFAVDDAMLVPTTSTATTKDGGSWRNGNTMRDATDGGGQQ